MRACLLPCLLFLSACGAEGPPDVIECETAGDCSIDEACRDARCVPLDEVGEGEGEGEGEWIASACARFASCAVATVEECTNALTNESAQLVASQGDRCDEAMIAMEVAYTCLNGVSCEALENGTWVDQCGPQFDNASVLRDICLNGGSGEGEGEGEGEACFEANVLPAGTRDVPPLTIHVAQRDPAFDDQCAGAAAVGLVIEVATDVTQPLSGLASFDGETTVELLSIRAEDEFIVSAIACSVAFEPFVIAVTLAIDGNFAVPACAEVQQLDGGMTP